MPAMMISDGETVLRAVGWPFGILTVLSVWWLARQMGGAVAALAAAGLVATAPTILDQSTLLMTDIPAAALLLVTAVVLWRELELRPTPSWWLVVIAPLAAAAFEIRYGSVVAVTALALGGLVVWLPRPLRAWPKVAVTGGLFALLLTPHVVGAIREFGSPIRRLMPGGNLSGGEYNAVEGLIRYGELFPFRLAGPLAAAAMLFGLVAAIGGLVIAWRRGHTDTNTRVRAFLTVTAVAQIVIFGAMSGPVPRYILFAVALLCVLAGFELTRAITRLASSRLTPVVPASMLAAVLLVAFYGVISFGVAYSNRQDSVSAYAEVASAANRAETLSEGSCNVMTSYSPQVTWYSGCATTSFGHLDELSGDSQFVFLIAEGKRQPEGTQLRRCMEALRPAIARFEDSDGKKLGDSALYPVESPGDGSCARG
jgi:4-amino-4-deoxy-L-arabinose transferase-like glycosyltransferase